MSTPSGKKIGLDYLPFGCELKGGRMYIREEVQSVREEYSRSKNTVWQ